jgi:hypothetical protein
MFMSRFLPLTDLFFGRERRRNRRGRNNRKNHRNRRRN